MGSRRKARILAFQALFGWEMNGAEDQEIQDLSGISLMQNADAPLQDAETELFARVLIAGTMENIGEVDKVIQDQLEHWDFKRIRRVDLAILRMSVYALLFQQDIPASVTIDEAVDIAKEFGTDDSYRFINGVLDGIYKRRNAT